MGNSVLDRISASIRKSDPRAQAYLFGSRARGNHRADSDWDVLILVDDEKVTDSLENRFRDGLYDIELDQGQVISTFIYPKSKWEQDLRFSPLHTAVELEGVRL